MIIRAATVSERPRSAASLNKKHAERGRSFTVAALMVVIEVAGDQIYLVGSSTPASSNPNFLSIQLSQRPQAWPCSSG